MRTTAALFLSSLILFICSAHLSARQAPPSEAFTVLEPAPKPGRQITPYLRYQVEAAWRQDELRRARLAAVSTQSDLLELQRETREKLLEIIGGLPEARPPLNARITGTIRLEGYRVEKLVYESLPGFHVTALVYVPDGAGPGPRPAVLVPCGHSPVAKASAHYQRMSARLAMRGYVVLCWDPVGQGERSQFWDPQKGESRYNRVCGEHAVLGNLAYLAGASLARWEIIDGMRAADYLLTRPDVDPGRISITGTSGGGCQSALIGALDQRIGVVAPSCYISALPMRMNNRIFADPDSDPEQDIFRMVSAGVGHPGLLFLCYPRPVIVCAAVEDFFPIEGTRRTFREIEAVYRRFGCGDSIALIEGYHRHSYSDQNQEAAFALLDRFNSMPVRHSLDSIQVQDEKDLWCTRSGQVRLEFPDGKSLFELIRDYYLERKGKISLGLRDLYYGSNYPGINNWPVVERKGKSFPEAAIAWEAAGSSAFEGITIDRYVLRHSRRLSIPVLHFYKKGKGTETTACLRFGSNGKATAADWPLIKKIVDNNRRQVVSFDFRALGEGRMRYKALSIDDPRLAEMSAYEQYTSPISGVLANYVYNSLLTGRPYFLQMIEDAEIVARFVKQKLGLMDDYFIQGSDEEAAVLAFRIAQTLPEIELYEDYDIPAFDWSTLVEEMREGWPIQFLLPYGAYVR
ncbi:MAG: acetylxylan esterase [Gemmatimonadota bacterium]|nr:acetylxylan esterase [Gemmatimonadota bacterium]